MAATWCTCGSPAGIELDFDVEGVFPRADSDSDLEDPSSLQTDYESFTNYLGFDDDPEAVQEIEGFWKKGYLRKYNDLDGVRNHLQSDPVLSGASLREQSRAMQESLRDKSRGIHKSLREKSQGIYTSLREKSQGMNGIS